MEVRRGGSRLVSRLCLPLGCLAVLAGCGDSATGSPVSKQPLTCTTVESCLSAARAAGDRSRIALPDPQEFPFVVGRIHAADSGIPHWWFRLEFVSRSSSLHLEESVIPFSQSLACTSVGIRQAETLTAADRRVCARADGAFYVTMGALYTVYLTPAATPPSTPPGLEASLLQFIDSLR